MLEPIVHNIVESTISRFLREVLGLKYGDQYWINQPEAETDILQWKTLLRLIFPPSRFGVSPILMTRLKIWSCEGGTDYCD